MVSFKLKTMLPEDEFLALPWDLRLEDWPEETTVILPVGTHRNVVRFVPLAGEFLALKELPHRLAMREFDVLSTMRERSLPAVTLIGIASKREDHREPKEQDDVAHDRGDRESGSGIERKLPEEGHLEQAWKIALREQS